MIPTFAGRIETRLLTNIILGLPIAIIIGLLIGNISFTIFALALMFFIGLLWDSLYSTLQNRRWEGDWPPILMFLGGIAEGFFLLIFLNLFAKVNIYTFLTMYLLIWTTTFLFQLILNIFFPYRRFRGGRIF